MKDPTLLSLTLFLFFTLSAQKLTRDTVVNFQFHETFKPSALYDTSDYKIVASDSTIYYWLTSWNRVTIRIVDDEVNKVVNETEYSLGEISCDTIDLVDPGNGEAFAKSIYCRQSAVKDGHSVFYDENGHVKSKETYENGKLISSEF